MITLLAVLGVMWACRIHVRVATAERTAAQALRKMDASERADAARTAAVLHALRTVARTVADEMQPALGTLREDAVRTTAIAYYKAIETIENTEP